MKAALYMRVSTTHQDEGTQRKNLRAYCEAHGWAVAEEYVDHVSGKGECTHQRAEWLRLMESSRSERRRFDVVLVDCYDRAARDLVVLVQTLDELRAFGVAFVSLKEHFDTTTDAGRLMFQVFASLAEFQRRAIVRRSTEGLHRAMEQGIRVGRPVVEVDCEAVHRLRAPARGGDVWSWLRIAKAMGIPKSTVHAAYTAWLSGVRKTPSPAGAVRPSENRSETTSNNL